MSLEEIYADLDKITRHQGVLNEEAVLGATTILALPRYVDSPNKATLLVEDIKHVISTIPNYPPPKGRDIKAWSVYNFHDWARRLFSLDEAGTALTHRRRFGRKAEPGGAETTWIHRAVLLRVASGLFELHADDRTSASGVAPSQGYRIESLRVARRIKRHSEESLPRRSPLWERLSLFPYTDTLEYNLRLLTPGTHSFVVPFPPRYTKLIGYDNQDQNLRLETTANDQAVPMLMFGSQREPGSLITIRAQHRPLMIKPSLVFPTVIYVVDQPMDELTLVVNMSRSVQDEYDWHIIRPEIVGDDISLAINKPEWSCKNPHVGWHYQLSGYPAQ